VSDTLIRAVPDRHDGDRLDRTLAALFPDRSRAQIQKHIEAGAVLIDGALPKRGSSTQVTAGAKLSYTPPPIEPLDLVAEDIPLSILFEDPYLLIVDKPAGLVVHPGAGHSRGTLVNAVLHHVQDLEHDEDDLRPGIVHRLDRDTTGCLVIAKDPRTHELLSKKFADREVEKIYLAIVKGTPKPSGTFDTWYGRHPTDRKRFSSKVKTGKRAVTHWRVLEQFDVAALVEVRLETGRTHQIRAHFSDAGHALIGDPMYAKKSPVDFGRPALHARRLAFTHPVTEAPMVAEAPIPEDLTALLLKLR
jgi:23S rRNA pseudouridine1911/1915/1917 synthase